MLIVGITGTPGSGKTYFSMQIIKKFKNAAVIELNNVVNKYNAFYKIDNEKTKIVNISKLNRIVNKQIKEFRQMQTKSNKNLLIVYVGHLVPELKIKLDLCFAIRSKLKILEKRLKKRRYSKEKIKENLICEAEDYCGIKAKIISKLFYEIETKNEKNHAMHIIEFMQKGIDLAELKKIGLRNSIDKMPELLELIKNKNIYNL